MDVTSELLSAFPLLRPLSESAINELASCSLVQKYSRRGVVLDPNQREDVIYFLFEGRLQGVDFTVDGREVGLYFVEPGDFCGEVLLFDDLPSPELVIALRSSLVVKIPILQFKKVMLETPHAVNTLGKKLARRIKQLTSQRSLLAISNTQQRVCCQLWKLVADKHNPSYGIENNELELRDPPTHLEIANMLSISRETVTRVFQTLQTRQIVRRNGANSMIICDWKVLKNLAEGIEII